jgi:signal transduction histidine kinase/ligand-binding sensor domain-containing protein
MLLVACLAVAPLRGQELPFTHFTTENQIAALPSASVQQVYQDAIGFIWFAFYSSGIARYDGHSLEIFSTEDGLPDMTARELLEDGRGHLWVGTESGLAVSEKALAAYRPGERIRFLRRVGSTPLVQTRIRRNWMGRDQAGGIWVGTTGHGLFHYAWEGSTGLVERRVLLDDASGEPPANISALLVDNSNSVVVGTTNGAIHQFGPAGRVTLLVPATDAAATTLYRAEDGALWIGRVNGSIWRMAKGEDEPSLVSNALKSRIFTILELPGGEFWIASLGSGALRWRDGEAGAINRQNGMLSNSLWSISRDREGNLWFAQNGGVSRLRPGYEAFSAFTGRSHAGEGPVLPDPSVFGVLAERPAMTGSSAQIRLGEFQWVGTGAGLVAMQEGQRSMVIDTGDGLRGSAVYSLAYDRSGRLWIGTIEGLNVISAPGDEPAGGSGRTSRRIAVGGRNASLTSWPTAGPVYTIRSFLHPGPDGPREAVWISGSSELRCWFGGRWIGFHQRSGIPPTGTANVVLEPSGHLWVATVDRGVLRSREPLTVPFLAGLPARMEQPLFDVRWSGEADEGSANVHSLVWHEGTLWAGTARGLFALRGDPLQAELIRIHGTLPNVLSLTLSADHALLWMATNSGLAAIDPQSGSTVHRVSRAEGLLDNEAWGFSTLDVARDGTVLFGTPRGLGVYRPHFDIRTLSPPEVVARDFDLRQSSSGANDVHFHYAALTFSNEQKVRYRYRLANFDPNWSEPTSEHRVRYTNLPAIFFPRDYRLEVIATNGDGVWSAEPLIWDFVINPAWWLSWWSFALIGLLGGGSLYGTNRYRTRRLESANRALEESVRERTAEITAQARELATLENIVRVINQEVELERLMELLLEQGRILFPQAEKGAFLVVDPARQTCEFAAASGYDREDLSTIRFSPAEARSRYCEGAELLGEGVYLSRLFDHRPGQEKITHLPVPKSMLTMEVNVGETFEGYLVFDNFSDPDAFGRSDLQRLGRFRQHVVSAFTKLRMLRELQLKNAEADKANQAKSAFLAAMSHELRTPLNSIIGFSEVLVERLDAADERSRHFLSLILASGQHLLALINDILDLSKVEAGRMEVLADTVASGDLIESVGAVMRGLSGRKAISIVYDLPSDLPQIETDVGKFKQILYNLMTNAVKFSPQGSTITVSARVVPGVSDRERLSVSVQDEGIGIAQKDLARIFDEFVQLDNTLTRRFEGTGLGLSLVRKYVELLGGTVSVESEPGGGSTFTFTLPLQLERSLSDSGTRRPRYSEAG